MRKKIISFYMIFLFLLGYSYASYALEVETHEAINEHIANMAFNGFSLSGYLNKNLGFTKGKDELIKGTNVEQEVYKWLSDGGRYEDAPPWSLPYRRSVNHFHNPINEQGFSGIWDTGFRSGMSATLWATQLKNSQDTDGNYSWADVRGYYLNALTSTDKTTRDSDFASTFRGLGQLMHLVQDMSVPEHTRNDGHYLLCCDYEHWVKGNPGSVNTAASAPIFFNGIINNIASFMDTNKYNGSNPNDTANLTTGSNGTRYSNIGLSEFSNANFFSDDSIFTGFTYPSIAGASLWTDTTNNRQYLKKTTEGVPIEHLATSSWLYFYRWQKFPQYSEWLPLGLDSKVYSDYAALLLPRAVGYSAGLLDYFFRGKIDMIIDPNNLSRYIIKNLSNENMFGTFSLYYDDANDNRYLAASWRNLAINANNQSSPVTFTAPSSPAPKEKGKYILVFQGTFGNEIGAVMGKVVEGLCAGTWVCSSCTSEGCGIYYCESVCAEAYSNCDSAFKSVDSIAGDTITVKYYCGEEGTESSCVSSYWGCPFASYSEGICWYLTGTLILKWQC